MTETVGETESRVARGIKPTYEELLEKVTLLEQQRAARTGPGQVEVEWLVGGGEMGELIRSTDWSITPFGARERWPQSLRTVASLLVESKFPMALLWGRELLFLYNDAYRVIAAGKHPAALGRSTREIWPEVWHINEPIFTAVLDRGETIYLQDQVFRIDRKGLLEDAYFTLSYSPVRAEDGTVAGTLVTLLETTERKQAEEALQRSHQLFCLVVDNAPDSMAIYDAERRHTFVNAAGLRRMGKSLQDLVGRRIDELYDEEARKPFWPALMHAYATGEAQTVECALALPQGRRDLIIRFVPLKGADGKVNNVLNATFDITERKRAEDALRLSAQKFAAVYDHSPQSMALIKAPEGTLVDVNEAWERFFECPRQQAVGTTADELGLVSEPGLKDRMYAEIQSCGYVRDWEMSYRTRSGEDHIGSFNFDRIEIDGQAYHLGTVIDITERKLAEKERARLEAAVLERAAVLDVTIDSIAIGLIIYDAKGRSTRANSAAKEILPSEFFARPTVEERLRAWQWETEDGRRFLAEDVPVARALRGEVTKDVIMVAPIRNQRLWISVSAAPIRTTDGKLLGAVGSFYDITKPKRAEEELRKSEERFRLAAAASHAMVYDLDMRAMRVDELRGLPELFGYQMGEVEMSLDWWDKRILPEDAFKCRAILQQRVDNADAEAMIQYRVRHKDGRILWVEDNATLVRDEAGRLVRIVGTVVDTTTRVTAEDALKESNARLVEADRRKNEFLGMLSHELRNPLTPIRNSLYILERAAAGGEQAHRAQAVIDRQVNHLVRLVEDLLDVTRITRGKMQLQRTRLDLTNVVRGTVDDFRSSLERHEVAIELPSEAIWIDGDRTRLAQVVGNLVHNAAKFTPEGGKISVLLTQVQARAMLEVADTGTGIDTDMLGRLFEPFAQADRSLDRSGGGLGLGLALVKGVVELHGGSVTAHSEGPGRGARFTVSLPIHVGGAANGNSA